MGIVNRAQFESKLYAHLTSSASSHDPSWYALRNVIFAFGSRIHLSKVVSYAKATKESMGFFSNALSVQADMMQCRSSLLTVKALILMVRFLL